MTNIYADYAGSSDLTKEVKDYLIERIKSGPFANPNASHHLGKTLMGGIEEARKICAKNVNARKDQIIFNSGSTEGVTNVFCSVLKKHNKNTIILSAIEHPCTMNAAKYYQENHGYNLEIIPVNEDGIIHFDVLKELIIKQGEEIGLVAIMASNNETGIIQPIEDITKLLNKYQIPYLCDTTQYIGKVPFNFETSAIDYAVLSGHKIGALTGTGFLLAKDPSTISPLLIGGGQENGHRGGTQNYLGIETMAVAINNNDQKLKNFEKIKQKKLEFEKKIKEKFKTVYIVGENSARVPGSTYISYPGIHGQAIQIELESQGIFVSTSSACSDNDIRTSKVLKSMGIDDKIGRGVIRISLNHDNPLEYYDRIFEVLSHTYEKLATLNNCL